MYNIKGYFHIIEGILELYKTPFCFTKYLLFSYISTKGNLWIRKG